MSVLTTLASAAIKTKVFCKDHEAAIEIGAGIACFAASVALAARAGIKTKEKVEEYNAVKELVQPDDKKKMKWKTIGKVALDWTPVVLGFAGGTGLILRAHHVMVRTNLGLAAALKTANEALDVYRKRVADKIGAEDEQLLYEGKEKVVNKTKVKDENGKTKTVETEEYRRFGSPISPYSILMSRDTVKRDADWCNSSNDYNLYRVKAAEDWINRKFKREEEVSLLDAVDALGYDIPDKETRDKFRIVGWKSRRLGGKTDVDGIKFTILDGVLKENPNDTNWTRDEFTGELRRSADAFWVDFNVEGCILGGATINKLGGAA